MSSILSELLNTLQSQQRQSLQQKINTFINYPQNEFGFIDYDFGTREDKTPKGLGYYGQIPLKDGFMTELGAHGEYKEKDFYYPLLVPGLTYDEIEFLKNMKPDQRIPDEIHKKAYDFAVERVKKGLPTWALPNEEGRTPYPTREINEKQNR